MMTWIWAWLMLPGLLFLSGCPDDGGEGGEGGNIVSSVAYVANSGSNNVSAYTITAGTGVLTPVAGSPFVAGTTPSGVTISPDGQFLYVANSGGNVSGYRITAGTGALDSLGAAFAAGTTPVSIATPGRP